MKNRQVPLLAVGLALALGIVVFSWRYSQPRASAPGPSASTAMPLQTLLEGVDQALASVQTQVEARARPLDVRALPDKAVIPVAPVEETPELTEPPAPQKKVLRLQGVVRNGGQGMAFIENRTVAVGELIEGYTVEEIGAEYVVLKDSAGEKTTLRLYEAP